MALQLTAGSVQRLQSGEKMPGPIVQMIDIKILKSLNQPDRFRAVLSDGTHFLSSVLAAQCTTQVTSGQLKTNCVIKLIDFATSDIAGSSQMPSQQRRVLIVAKLEVLQSLQQKIGNPVPVESATAAAQPSTSAVKPPVALARQQQAAPVAAAAAQGGMMAGASRPIPARGGMVADAGDLARLPTHPVRSLNPYQGRWVIKVRVTNKSDVREFNGARGPGKLFSVDLVDASGDQIRATAFTDAVDRLFPMFEVGRAYFISHGHVKPVNRAYNKLPHEYEVNMSADTVVQPAEDNAPEIGQPAYHFVKIADLAMANKDDTVDVLGVATSVGEVAKIVQKKTNKTLSKRSLTLVDSTSHSIEITLWGDRAEQLAAPSDPGFVVAVRGCKVSDFNNRSLSAVGSSQVTVSPDMPEATQLLAWYESARGSLVPNALTVQSGGLSGAGGDGAGAGMHDAPKPLSSIKDEQLGMQNQGGDYLSVVGVITEFKHSVKITYDACPRCNCKVVTTTDGTLACGGKCNNAPVEQSVPRYILSFRVLDHSGGYWISCFHDLAANTLLGRQAAELEQLKSTDEAAYEAFFYEKGFKWWNFRMRAKMENYQQTERTKVTALSASPLDFIKESQRLIQVIASYG